MDHGSMRRQLGFTKTAHLALQEALIEIVSAAAAEASGSSQGGVFIGEFAFQSSSSALQMQFSQLARKPAVSQRICLIQLISSASSCTTKHVLPDMERYHCRHAVCCMCCNLLPLHPSGRIMMPNHVVQHSLAAM